MNFAVSASTVGLPLSSLLFIPFLFRCRGVSFSWFRRFSRLIERLVVPGSFPTTGRLPWRRTFPDCVPGSQFSLSESPDASMRLVRRTRGFEPSFSDLVSNFRMFTSTFCNLAKDDVVREIFGLSLDKSAGAFRFTDTDVVCEIGLLRVDRGALLFADPDRIKPSSPSAEPFCSCSACTFNALRASLSQ